MDKVLNALNEAVLLCEFAVPLIEYLLLSQMPLFLVTI